MQRSPYTPGQVAKEIYGRDNLLTQIQRDLGFLLIEPALVGRVQVFAGPRGVGKTSLLRSAQSYAAQKGFSTVFVTAGDGSLVQSIGEALELSAASWKNDVGEVILDLLKGLRVELAGVSVGGLEGKQTPEPQGHRRKLQQLLVSAGEAAAKQSKGLIIFIDEVQSADADGIKALAYAWQHMQSENAELPMAVYAAGLSHSQDVITDAVSFAERFKYHRLQNLAPEDAALALRSPAEAKGVRWGDDALAQALKMAGGYPYFLQVVGDATWSSAGHPGPGTTLDVEQVQRSKEEFDRMRDSFFRARWKKATPAEARLLKAMAVQGEGPAKRSDIATAMGKESTEISMARRSLLDKGLIDVAGYGYLVFTAPGFAHFIRQESDSDM